MSLLKTLIIGLLLLLASPSWGQRVTKVDPAAAIRHKKTPTWQKKPEPPSETVTAAWAPVAVEHYFGVRGGYGMGMIRLEPQKNSKSLMGLWSGGIMYRFDVPRQKYVGCLEIDLEYMQKGYGYETFNNSKVINERRYSVLMLPILWQPYLPLSKAGTSRFFLNLGPYVGYALESSYRIYNEDTPDNPINEGPYKYDQLRDNRFEFGVTLGAGFVVTIKKLVSLSVDFRYNIMLSDTFKGVDQNPSNPFRSPVDQLNISFGISYRFLSKRAREVLASPERIIK